MFGPHIMFLVPEPAGNGIENDLIDSELVIFLETISRGSENAMSRVLKTLCLIDLTSSVQVHCDRQDLHSSFCAVKNPTRMIV